MLPCRITPVSYTHLEVPDNWLKHGSPFELKRPEYAKEVKFGGYGAQEYDEATGRVNFVQKDYQSVNAIPYDMPIVGYDNDVVNTLTICCLLYTSQYDLNAGLQ